MYYVTCVETHLLYLYFPGRLGVVCDLVLLFILYYTGSYLHLVCFCLHLDLFFFVDYC